ncbi:hypothetical protein TrLO_g3244 [Triparma laevis f. longispina]|uniref:Uncharacterized protein n=1 Tax=Triparma laevis f. longispina TaxID=1714387 RepID=A0A9W7AEK1_9STRA|nr:hypothetical protein TrLO_g3244 [Triparma laevis f. longispina]
MPTPRKNGGEKGTELRPMPTPTTTPSSSTTKSNADNTISAAQRLSSISSSNDEGSDDDSPGLKTSPIEPNITHHNVVAAPPPELSTTTTKQNPAVSTAGGPPNPKLKRSITGPLRKSNNSGKTKPASIWKTHKTGVVDSEETTAKTDPSPLYSPQPSGPTSFTQDLKIPPSPQTSKQESTDSGENSDSSPRSELSESDPTELVTEASWFYSLFMAIITTTYFARDPFGDNAVRFFSFEPNLLLHPKLW